VCRSITGVLPPALSNEAEVSFHNIITGNIMVYEDRLETNLLQLFTYPENSEQVSIISGIIFEVNIVAEQKQAYWY